MKFLFQSVIFFFSFLNGVQASLMQEQEETSKKIYLIKMVRVYFIKKHRFYTSETSQIIPEIAAKMKLTRDFERDAENGLSIHGFNYNLGYKIPEEVFKPEFDGRTLTLSSYIKTKIPKTFRVQLCYVKNGHITSYGNSKLHPGDGEWYKIKTSIRLNKSEGTLHIRPISALYKPIGALYDDDAKNAISILYFSLYLAQDNQNIKEEDSSLDIISAPRTTSLRETIDMKTLLENEENLKEALKILESKGYNLKKTEENNKGKEDFPKSRNKNLKYQNTSNCLNCLTCNIF